MGDLPVLMGHPLPSPSPPSCIPKLAQTHISLCPLLPHVSVLEMPVRAQTSWSPPELLLSPYAPSLPLSLTKAYLSPAGRLLPCQDQVSHPCLGTLQGWAPSCAPQSPVAARTPGILFQFCHWLMALPQCLSFP